MCARPGTQSPLSGQANTDDRERRFSNGCATEANSTSIPTSIGSRSTSRRGGQDSRIFANLVSRSRWHGPNINCGAESVGGRHLWAVERGGRLHRGEPLGAEPVEYLLLERVEIYLPDPVRQMKGEVLEPLLELGQ